MFKGNKNKLSPDTTDTLIGAGTVFEGTIKSEAGIRVEGKVIGDIESKGDVIIGENGTAHSNICARNLILAGQLTGNAEATGKLTICAKGSLIGNVTAQSFIIEAGGVFNGTSRMTVNKTEAASEKLP